MPATRTAPDAHYVVLSGGVGGAKLALGLHCALPAGALTVIANTGDDFTHLGLAISPDLDTLMYTLADLVNPETGWGCRAETWHFMEALAQLGGETWFRLGDRDLATHVERTRRLATGEPLSRITQDFCQRLGLGSRILPMTDSAVRTEVVTDRGVLGFQDYFVRSGARPVVSGFRYGSAATVLPAPGVIESLRDPRLAGIFIAPSNPWLSIDPILSIPALRQAVRDSAAPVIAISPIVGGAALKGPTAKIMAELGIAVSALSVARHYRESLDGFILDHGDTAALVAVRELGLAAASTHTVMRTLENKISLGRFALEFAATLAAEEQHD